MAEYTNDMFGLQQLMRDEEAAKEQAAIVNAVNLAGTPRASMLANTINIAEGQGNAYANLGRMLTGEGAPVDPRVERMQRLEAIADQMPDPQTEQDYLKLAQMLRAADLPGEAQKAMEMVNSIRSAAIPKTPTSFENASLQNVLNSPEYLLAIKENRPLEANKLINEAYTNFNQASSTSKPTYKTFYSNDESGNKVTKTYLVPPTGVLLQDKNGNFIDKPVETFTEARKTLKDGDTWKFLDNGKPVFSGATATPDENDLADEAYEKFFTANPQLLATPKGNKDFLLTLIEQRLTGSNKFTQIISSIDQDGVNEIQRRIGIEKGIERLSVNYTKSDVGQMDSILKPIETQINEYMPHLTTVSGDLLYDRNGNAMRDTSKGLPGWELLKRGQRYFGSAETVRAAKNFAEDAQLLLNTIIKQRSGSAVSIQEAERLVKEYETGLPSSESFANWVSAVRKITESRRMGIVAGSTPEVQYGYFSQMGILPTLYDPENQEKLLPIGARWKDEAGNEYVKTQ